MYGTCTDGSNESMISCCVTHTMGDWDQGVFGFGLGFVWPEGGKVVVELTMCIFPARVWGENNGFICMLVIQQWHASCNVSYSSFRE